MHKFKIRKNKEKSILGSKIRMYIDFSILICCLVVIFNIYTHYSYLTNSPKDILYIFHDYEGNQYVLNDTYHGSADDFGFLMDTTIPESIKSDDHSHGAGSASLASLGYNSDSNDDKNVKDNQISFEEVMDDLGMDSNYNYSENNDILVIDISDTADDDKTIYDVYQSSGKNDSSLVIEKRNNSDSDQTTHDSIKTFSFIYEGWILPTLADRDEIFNQGGSTSNIGFYDSENVKSSGVTIIDKYKDCLTPWGYKISHGDSVLAYHQMDNAPDICNIERRFCRNGKLSGTYTQQGCSVNKGYTFSQRGEAEIIEKKEEKKSATTQNEDGSVTVNNQEIGSSFVFDKPNNTRTEYYSGVNIREDQEVEQTKRPKWGCTAPWGEKIPHGQLVQAFRHENGFSDAPCEAQLRMCTMGELIGTFTQPTCKTWDTSFIDWINGSPTRETYSKEKLDRVRSQIKAEQSYDKNYGRFTNSDALDKILGILDS